MKLKLSTKLLLAFPILALSTTLASCAHQGQQNPASGDIVYGPDPYTYLATYAAKDSLKVGEKVRIMTYEFNGSLKERQGRNFPLSSSKAQIGEATVSTVLSKNYYELKTKEPRPLPGNAFIEKL